MHKENIYGLGLSLMDLKVKPQVDNAASQKLPRDFESFSAFIDKSELMHYCAGGIVSNILMAYAQFRPQSKIALFAALGQDRYGDLYQERVEKHLGKLQRIKEEPTGLVGYLIDYNSGEFTDKVSFYKAAEHAIVPIDQLREQPQGMLVSSAALFSMPHLHNELNKALQELRGGEALFALNLGGCRPDKTDKATLAKELLSSSFFPQLIFGNEKEIMYVSGEENAEAAVSTLFPNTRVLIMTRAGQGSLIRYEGEVLSIPAAPLRKTSALDESGAGDCYMGVMLACLNVEPSTKWNKQSVTHAARTAAFAAARVVESDETQLPSDSVSLIQRFYANNY
jgi:sugar/nucleoside kinase (ribokinase family)